MRFRNRIVSSFLPVLLLAACSARAGDFNPASHEEWSGTYRCGPLAKDPERPGYTSGVRLVLENGKATINKESATVKEDMSGAVAPDGRVTLEGSGAWKASGQSWRYRFEGQFEGGKFEARGAMYSSNGTTKLRDCSMALARVTASGGRSAKPPASAPSKEAPSAAPPPVAEKAATTAGAPPEAPPPAPAVEPSAPAPAPTATPDIVSPPLPEPPQAATVEPASTPVAVAPTEVQDGKKAEPAIGHDPWVKRALLALFLGVGVMGAGVLAYDWRQPEWLTPRYALAALLALAVGVSGIAFWLLPIR